MVSDVFELSLQIHSSMGNHDPDLCLTSLYTEHDLKILKSCRPKVKEENFRNRIKRVALLDL